MNEQQLNLEIARLVYPEYDVKVHPHTHIDTEILITRIFGSIEVVDYCNNWNDLMPLIIKYDIHHAPPYKKGGMHTVQQYLREERDFGVETLHINLQIALAECLLKALKE